MRLPDAHDDDDGDGVKEAYDMDVIQLDYEPEPIPIPEPRPDPKPPEKGLRGRTLCLFAKDNILRVFLDRMLRFSLATPVFASRTDACQCD